MIRRAVPALRGCLVVSLFLLHSAAAAVETTFRLELRAGQDIELQRFSGSGKSLLLWLPSERGLGNAHRAHAHALAEMGHEVWLADLHDAYFVERNRTSIERFPLEDVIALVDAAIRATDANLVLLSSSRGAQLALIAAREWQLRNPGKPRIEGLVLTHAHLYESRPEAGETANYLPIVSATNLPVYLLDAQYSTKSARIDELAKMLGDGGSQVYTQVVRNVQGGFFARDDSELSDYDLAAKNNYAVIVGRAIKLLRLAPIPHNALPGKVDTRRFSRNPERTSVLMPVARPIPAPALSLDDFGAGGFNLENHRGRVVLVNFWASWCRPCVREIPSLHRLRAKIESPGFEIVTVNVGEGRDRITRFLERVPVELPVLLDIDSSSARDWNVYVYPSSYLVDHRGEIRYAYLGALEWDSTKNIKIIRDLLGQR